MDNYRREIEDLLTLAAEQGASDLHIAPGRHPTLRIDGELVQLTQRPIITPETSEGLCLALMDEEKKARFKKEKEIDFAFGFKEQFRFRTNVYIQKGYISAALRLISYKIRTLEELHLPQVLREFTRPSQVKGQAQIPAASRLSDVTCQDR